MLIAGLYDSTSHCLAKKYLGATVTKDIARTEVKIVCSSTGSPNQAKIN